MEKINFSDKAVPELIWELTTGATGVDDMSTARWIWTIIQQDVDPASRNTIERAIIHWEHANEAERDAIGPFIGLGEPHGERWPGLPQMKVDYEYVLHVVAQLTDPGEGYAG